MSIDQEAVAVFCGWEGNRRSGVVLAMRHSLHGVPTSGLNGLSKGMSTPQRLLYYTPLSMAPLTFYIFPSSLPITFYRTTINTTRDLGTAINTPVGPGKARPKIVFWYI